MKSTSSLAGRWWMSCLLSLTLLVGCRSADRANFSEWLAEPDGLEKVLDVVRDPDSLMGTRVRAITALIEGGWVSKEQKRIEEAIAWCPNPADVAVRASEEFLGRLGEEVTDTQRSIADGLLMLAGIMGPSKAARFRQEVAQWVFAPLDAGGERDEMATQVKQRLDPARFWSLGAEGVPYYLQVVKAQIEFEGFPISSMVRMVLGDEDPVTQKRFFTALLQGSNYAKALQAFGAVVADETIPTALRVRLVSVMARLGWTSQIRAVVKQSADAQKFASTACRALLLDLVSAQGEDALAARDALFSLITLLPADEMAGVRSKLSAWAFQNVDTSKGPEETWKQLQTRIRPGQVVFLGDAAIPVVLLMLGKRAESPDFTCSTMLAFLFDVGSDAVKDQALEAYQEGLEAGLKKLASDGQAIAAMDTALQLELPALERLGIAEAVVPLGMVASAPHLPAATRRQALETAFRMLDNPALGGRKATAVDAAAIALVQCFSLAPADDRGTWFRNLMVKLGVLLGIERIAEFPYLQDAGLDLPAWHNDQEMSLLATLANLNLELWRQTMKEATDSLMAAERERDPFGVAQFSPEQIASWEDALDGASLETLTEWTKSPYEVQKVLGVMGLRYFGTAKALERLRAMERDPTDLSLLLGEGVTLGTISAASAKAVAYLREHPEVSVPLADSRLAERLSAKLGDKLGLRETLLLGPYSGETVPTEAIRAEYEALVKHIKSERTALVGVIRATRRTVETLCFEQAKDHPDATQKELLDEFMKKSAEACKRNVEKTLGEEALSLASLDDVFYLRSTALGVARWEHLKQYQRLKTMRTYIKFSVDSDARDGTLKNRLAGVSVWDLQDPVLRPVLDLVTRNALTRARDEWKESNGAAGLSDQDLALIAGYTDPPQNFTMGAALASIYMLDGYRKSEGGADLRQAPYLDGLATLLKEGGALLGNEDVKRFFAARGGDAWFILREWSRRTEAEVVSTWLLDEKEKTACRTVVGELRKVIAAPVDAGVAAGTYSAIVAKEMQDHYPFLDYLIDALFESTAIQAAMRAE